MAKAPGNPPLAAEPVLAGSTFSFAWYQWFVLLAAAVASLLSGAVALGPVPASANAAGSFGQISTDGNYLYVCVANNQWKRTALNAF